MAIEFHCDHCGKAIRCGDEHAGKRGKCPACHQSVYIPTPSDQIEPLRLTPADTVEEQRRARLEQESRDLALRLLREKEAPPPESPAKGGTAPRPDTDARLPVDMETLVIEYVLCMADGNLDEAESLAREIRRDLRRAEDVMQRLTMDEIPPAQLAGIKRPVLVGFFKQLREKR